MTTKKQQLESLYEQHRNNPQSPLIIDGNSNLIFGEGNIDATLMFVGEAPGRDEDLLGRPFVGRSGQLLNKALEACGAARADVYITNIIKARPNNNRTPSEEEMKRCLPVLQQQIAIIKPKIICTLGACATNALLEKTVSITKLRGYAVPIGNIMLIPTYHPAYVLRDPNSYKNFLSDINFSCQTAKNIEK